MIGLPGHEERVLEALQFGLRQRLSREFMAGVRLEAHRDRLAFLADEIAFVLTRDVLADKVLEDVAEVPARGWVSTTNPPRFAQVELPRTWWQRLLRRPARTVVCPVIGNAVITSRAARVPVTGTALVKAEFFRTFPEATYEYPADLGRVRMLVRTGEPQRWSADVDYSDPTIWKGPTTR